MRKSIRYWLYGALILLVFTCIVPWPVELVFQLLFGWIGFIFRVFPQIRWVPERIISGIVFLSLLLVGLQLLLQWLYREMSSAKWRWSWTAAIVSIVLLMFAVGMAAVGIVHQTIWLTTSPERVFVEGSTRRRANVIRCASNLRQIGQGIALYQHQNGDRYPEDFRALLQVEDVTPEIFVCPASDDESATGPTTEAIAESMMQPKHHSYIYFGKGLIGKQPDDRVIATEPLENHNGEGVNVLYGDGHVEFFMKEQAESVLLRLGFQKVPTRQSTN